MNKIFESFKETIIKEAKKLDLKNIYITTANISGDMGTMKKNEIYIKSKSSEGKDYVFLNLANPNYEYYEDVHINDFKKYFRQIDPEKDIKEMKLLSKWDLVDFGEEFWVTYISGGGKLGYKEKLENSLKLKEGKFTFSKQFADSPKQAIAKTDGKSGRVDELVRDKVWVAKEYADSMFVVTKEDPRNLGADKIFGYVKKSGLIDKYLKESFENYEKNKNYEKNI